MGDELPSGGPKILSLEQLQKKTLPFGKYKGKTLDETPLEYLDWMVGQDWLKPPLKDYLEAYLGNPIIAKELEKLD